MVGTELRKPRRPSAVKKSKALTSFPPEKIYPKPPAKSEVETSCIARNVSDNVTYERKPDTPPTSRIKIISGDNGGAVVEKIAALPNLRGTAGAFVDRD